MASTRKRHFHFRKLPSVRLFCYEYFSNKRIKSKMAFQQLAGVAFTLRAEATFSLCELASVCSQGRVAFAITRFITSQ